MILGKLLGRIREPRALGFSVQKASARVLDVSRLSETKEGVEHTTKTHGLEGKRGVGKDTFGL